MDVLGIHKTNVCQRVNPVNQSLSFPMLSAWRCLSHPTRSCAANCRAHFIKPASIHLASAGMSSSATHTTPATTTIRAPPPYSHIPIHIPTYLFPRPTERSNNEPAKTPHAPSYTTHPLLTHPPFQSWLNTLTHSLSLQRSLNSHPFHADPYELKAVQVNHINYFGSESKPRIGFVSMQAEIRNSAGEFLPGVVFLRGGAVAVLVIIEEEDEEHGKEEGVKPSQNHHQWTILTSQPRIPAGSLQFLEIPAGMMDDDSGTFAGKAADEIYEELGIKLDAAKLLDLCVLSNHLTPHLGSMAEEKLAPGMYPSPGGSDEFIKLFAYIHRVAKGCVKEMEGKVGGNRAEGERIVLRVVKLDEVWRVAGRDAKALGAWALWRGLKEAGVV